ncbi:DUF4158 domain-containing protein [Candidiatus Paracoxiella cheracis]|uniref:DUF4158 domain-containing protein n=1 Tax=Candidiatus Paracoxiella cheracis TaxID=3405120 RepID=UPI003BF49E23
MANTTTTLLTTEERRALYDSPVLNDPERTEYFTFNNDEVKTRNSFKKLDDAIYFAISLAFFKLKYTLVNFRYRDVTLERQHVMQRYFSNQPTPRSFSNNKDVIARIENKVLETVGFSRFRGQKSETIIAILQKQAPLYPRQRQLCKALLNLLIKENIAIPALTTIQDCVTRIWNNEHFRIIKAYYRYTNKVQRELVLSLLNKTDEKNCIVSIRKDMKQFNTTDIHKELDKHEQLKAVFFIAKVVLPKLNLPAATIDYYASLINYYNGARLKQLNSDTIHLYLLCYSYSRFQIINDNLLEAFRKRTLDYTAKAKSEANNEAAKFIDELQTVRQKVHDLLMVIKNDKHKTSIPKSKLFRCVPESELASTAQILLSDKLDKHLLFWLYIDQNAHCIALNLRPLFLNLDISIVRNDMLKEVVTFMKQNVGVDNIISAPPYLIDWVKKSKEDFSYIVHDGVIHAKRLEFLLYKQLAHHIETNKLVLEHSIKHKAIEDNFIKLPKWKKDKSKLLQSLPYPKLRDAPNTLLQEK